MASHSTLVTTIQVTTPRYCFLESFRLDHDLQTHCQWCVFCELLSLSDRDAPLILMAMCYTLTVLFCNGVKKSLENS